MENNAHLIANVRAVFERLGSPLATASDEVVATAVIKSVQAAATLCDAIDAAWKAEEPKHVYEMLRGIADISEIVEIDAVQD